MRSYFAGACQWKSTHVHIIFHVMKSSDGSDVSLLELMQLVDKLEQCYGWISSSSFCLPWRCWLDLSVRTDGNQA